MAALAEHELEAPVLVHFDLVGLDMARGRQAAALPVVARVGPEAQVRDRVPPSGDPVLPAPVQRGRLIEVVGIVRPQLGRLVDDAVQHGRPGVGVFDERRQASTGDPAQVPVSLSLVERIVGSPGEAQRGSRSLQRIAELVPGLAARYAPRGHVVLRPAAEPPKEKGGSSKQGKESDGELSHCLPPRKTESGDPIPQREERWRGGTETRFAALPRSPESLPPPPWAAGSAPTRTRPTAEAALRSSLRGRTFPLHPQIGRIQTKLFTGLPD